MALTGKEIRILTLLAIDTAFFFLEIIIGYSVHSLALVADSFHMLNDIFSLIVALWAVRVAKNKNPDAKYTYGWKRAEILGALINAVFLIALCFSIFVEAVQRFFEPQEITNPKLILYVGSAGLVSNIIGLFLFHDHGHSHGGSDEESHSHGHAHGHSHQSVGMKSAASSSEIVLPSTIVEQQYEETSPLLEHSHSHSKAKPASSRSLNMHGVFLHVLGDALGNVGVIATAIFIWKTDYSWRFLFDPVISLVITCIIFASALPLSKKASKILLQATPSTVSADEVQTDILKVEGVLSIHDFHIWNLTESMSIASVHVDIAADPEQFAEIAKQVRAVFHSYGIHSATVQPEFVKSTNSMSRIPSAAAVSAYGSTSQEACLVDQMAKCNPSDCLPAQH